MMGPATKLAKLEPMGEERVEPDQDWETSGWALPIQEIEQGLSFVPVAPSEEPDPGSPRQLIPNRRIAVSDILPLTLNSGQVSLGVDPTCSSLPISPIFIKTGGLAEGGEQGGEEGSLVTYGLLDRLAELPNIPTELLSFESLSHWNGEIEDLDTEQLANALCAPSIDHQVKEEKQHKGGCRGENLKSPKKVEEERMDEGEDEEDIEEEDEEEAEGQFLVDLEPGGNSSGRCGLHQKHSHQDEMSNAAALQELCSPGGSGKQQLTVIALHKKRGEESLNRFKEEVRKYAVDHTFKETAKKFGIHHSTVSGWVKESEKQDKCANFGDFFREKGWLQARGS